MPIMPRPARLAVALATITALAAIPTTEAQTPSVQIADTQLTLPLSTTADVILTPSGNFEGRCVLTAGTTRCSGAPPIPPSPDNGPAATLTAPSDATADTPTPVTNTASNGAEVCVAASMPALVSWTGLVQPNSTTQVTFPAEGAYNLSLRCYNAHGVSPSVTRTVSVTDTVTPPPPPACSGPLMRPAGWSMSSIGWTQYGGRPYPPNTSTRLITLDALGYISLPFTPSPGDTLTMQIAAAAGTNTQSFTALYYTISECQGDFRAPVATPPANDPTLANACRRTMTGPEEAALLFRTTGTTPGVCQLTPGKSYYLNIIQAGSSTMILNRQSDCTASQCAWQVRF